MAENRLKNVFGQSRWQIISMLRKQPLGVKQLAQRLEITENAIRPHLTVLERDGLVKQKGIKQSGGKPAHIFELTSEAEQLFPKLYGGLISLMISEIQSTHSKKEYKDLLIGTAKRLSEKWPAISGSDEMKIQGGVDVLNRLGGLAEVDNEGGNLGIKGYSCPLAEVTKDHQDFCDVAEELLESLTGLKYHRLCDYEGKPKCRFKIAKAQ